MILTGYQTQDSNDEPLSSAKNSPIIMPFEPFGVVKDVVIGKIGIDGLCAVYEGNCAIVRASVWKDTQQDDAGDDPERPRNSQVDTEIVHEHDEIPLRDYQLAMLIRANGELERQMKGAISSSVYLQLGDSQSDWATAPTSGKYLARQDTVDPIVPVKADTNAQGRLLVTCTIYPRYVGVTFANQLDADTLNLSASTSKLIGAMNL